MIYKKNLQTEEWRNTNYAKSRVVVRLGWLLDFIEQTASIHMKKWREVFLTLESIMRNSKIKINEYPKLPISGAN